MQKTNDTQPVNTGNSKKSDNFFHSFALNLKKDYPVLILSVVAFIILGIICFLGVTKSLTVAAFSLNEYEVGQIADRTIEADRPLPATAAYPFAIGDHEKIIKKGFAITEDGYRKLEKMANTKEYIDYRAYVDSRLKEDVAVSDKKFTEDDYAELVEVNAGNDVEINGTKLQATDFLEILYTLFFEE